MFKYRKGEIVYFIGTDTESPHLCRIVDLFLDNKPAPVVRLDTIGVQDISTIRPFCTYREITLNERA